MSEKIGVEMQDRVMILELRRPQRKNAIDQEMYSALADALTRAAGDSSVRVVMLRAQGDAFSAGNDLADFMGAPDLGMDSPVFRFLTALLDFPKPLVAAVQGVAVGIGTTMLLHCDLVYASDKASFSLPFVPLGLVPEAASSLLLPRAIGHVKAAELLLLGERFDTATAERAGIINRVLPGDQVLDHALAKASTLAALPPGAVQATKALLKQPDAELRREVLHREADLFRERLKSAEVAEAIGAFMAKRKPDFSRF